MTIRVEVQDKTIEVRGELVARFHVLDEFNYGEEGPGGFLVFSNGLVLKVAYEGSWVIETLEGGEIGSTVVVTPADQQSDPSVTDKAKLDTPSGYSWVALATEVVPG